MRKPSSNSVPSARARHGRVEVPLLDLDEDALLRLSEEGQLSLDAIEMCTVQAHFREAGRGTLDL